MRSECGDVGIFRLAQRDVVLLTGADANEFFFRAPEELLDQAEAVDLRRRQQQRRHPLAASDDNKNFSATIPYPVAHLKTIRLVAARIWPSGKAPCSCSGTSNHQIS